MTIEYIKLMFFPISTFLGLLIIPLTLQIYNKARIKTDSIGAFAISFSYSIGFLGLYILLVYVVGYFLFDIAILPFHLP